MDGRELFDPDLLAAFEAQGGQWTQLQTIIAQLSLDVRRLTEEVREIKAAQWRTLPVNGGYKIVRDGPIASHGDLA